MAPYSRHAPLFFADGLGSSVLSWMTSSKIWIIGPMRFKLEDLGKTHKSCERIVSDYLMKSEFIRMGNR